MYFLLCLSPPCFDVKNPIFLLYHPKSLFIHSSETLVSSLLTFDSMIMAKGSQMSSPTIPSFATTSSMSRMSLTKSTHLHFHHLRTIESFKSLPARRISIRCVESPERTLRTCKNCKTQFDPALNHPRACRFHTAHFGGETKRKFESVYTGGTMDTPDSGQVLQYWHCCGSEDPFDAGCTAAPHSSYDD